MAKGYQDPDLRNGNVDIASCVSCRSSHSQLISLWPSKKWPMWTLDIKNAFLQADGFDRDVYLRAPCRWNTKGNRRAWRLRAPAYGLNDATVATHRPPRRYLVNSVELPPGVGLRSEVSSFGPRLYDIFRESGGAVGAIAAHIGDILGCGERDLSLKARSFSGARFGKLKGQDESIVCVGMDLAQEKDFSVTLTHGGLFGEPETPPNVTGTVGRPEGARVVG